MDQLDEFLAQIITDQITHAKWLNSLSYLEYRGARKIMRALATEDIDEKVLNHSMEEVRHALFFKRLAIKLGGQDFGRYSDKTLLSENSIKNYFYQLDLAANALVAEFGSKIEIYQLVTWLIEERAMIVYQKYEILLQKRSSSTNVKISLLPVLADESRHLKEVKNHLQVFLLVKGLSLDPLIQIEKRLFEQTLSTLRATLNMQQDCPTL